VKPPSRGGGRHLDVPEGGLAVLLDGRLGGLDVLPLHAAQPRPIHGDVEDLAGGPTLRIGGQKNKIILWITFLKQPNIKIVNSKSEEKRARIRNIIKTL